MHRLVALFIAGFLALEFTAAAAEPPTPAGSARPASAPLAEVADAGPQHASPIAGATAVATLTARALTSTPAGYLVQPGDLLAVTVWKEQDLTGDVLVRPDGGLSFPLVGDLVAMGKTVSQLQTEITTRLLKYIPSPVVTVEVKQVGGNHIYVVGKVQRPGEYPMVRPVDVMQALSLAGGTTPYAALNGIVILHRENGVEKAIHFRYSDVARGRDLYQNVLLQSGDTVVVP